MKKYLEMITKQYGIDNQKRKFVEEVYELLEVVTKYEDGTDDRTHLLEEFADVYVVYTILKNYYHIKNSDIRKIGRKKIMRQIQRISQ